MAPRLPDCCRGRCTIKKLFFSFLTSESNRCGTISMSWNSTASATMFAERRSKSSRIRYSLLQYQFGGHLASGGKPRFGGFWGRSVKGLFHALDGRRSNTPNDSENLLGALPVRVCPQSPLLPGLRDLCTYGFLGDIVIDL